MAQAFGFFSPASAGWNFTRPLREREDGTFSLAGARERERERDKAKDLLKVRVNLPRRNDIGSPGL
ncbi:hypothetical protein ONR75_30835 [Rhodopseudomonas sp. P2A-2r]|uniref:hypothetical protein n=1 Tax=Rhodopseudomonas sp. P2A-2r TaxID=2991972 RepID=UPI00223436C5|nr:hypothetical protein [Rhodopseudomonas sp. P2A-2r]UZE49054.1 hypothetical protein ONR75_30835 [Rhodopseudomonas sp. P2A-2r]